MAPKQMAACWTLGPEAKQLRPGVPHANGQMAIAATANPLHCQLQAGVTGCAHGPTSPASALPYPRGLQVFQKVAAEKKGKVQVFFCGSPALAKVLKGHCERFSFKFFQENF